MPETTPLIKAALNLRVGAGFDVYEKYGIMAQKKYKVGTGYDIRIIRSDQDDYEFGVFSDRDLFCTYVSKVKTKAMAMYLHVAFGIFILDHSRSIPGCLFFKPYGVSEYDP